jgi:S1-C subfamily serine protease
MKSLKAALSALAFVFCAPAFAGDLPPPDVRIESPGSIGSGTYLGDGRVLTAAHVVAGKEQIAVITQDGKRVEAKIEWFDTANDAAMLRAPVEAEAASYSCDVPKLGTHVEQVGNPEGLPFIHLWGRIAHNGIGFTPFGPRLWVDITAAPGSSGGGLYSVEDPNKRELVGVVSQVTMNNDKIQIEKKKYNIETIIPIMWAIPMSVICGLMKKP